jgi:hypothetical protein
MFLLKLWLELENKVWACTIASFAGMLKFAGARSNGL